MSDSEDGGWPEASEALTETFEWMVDGLIRGDLSLRRCSAADSSARDRILLARAMRGEFQLETTLSSEGRFLWKTRRVDDRVASLKLAFEVSASQEPASKSTSDARFYSALPPFVRSGPDGGLGVELVGADNLTGRFDAMGRLIEIRFGDETRPAGSWWPLRAGVAWLGALARTAREDSDDVSRRMRAIRLEEPTPNRHTMLDDLLASLAVAVSDPPDALRLPVSDLEGIGPSDPVTDAIRPNAYRLTALSISLQGWFGPNGEIAAPSDDVPAQQLDLSITLATQNPARPFELSFRPAGVHLEGPIVDSLLDRLPDAAEDARMESFFGSSITGLDSDARWVPIGPNRHELRGVSSLRDARDSFTEFIDSVMRDRRVSIVRGERRDRAIILMHGDFEREPAWLICSARIDVREGRVSSVEFLRGLGGSASTEDHPSRIDWLQLCGFFERQLEFIEARRRRMGARS